MSSSPSDWFSDLGSASPWLFSPDEALAKDFGLWLDHDAQTALHKIGDAAGSKILPDIIAGYEAWMLAAKMTPASHERALAHLAELNAANDNFVSFLLAESRWRKTYLK